MDEPKRTATTYGYCECGCGERTSLARQTSVRFGWVKGKPLRFVLGHNGRAQALPEKPCQGCGDLFRPKSARRLFCSRRCANGRTGEEHPQWKGGVLEREGRVLRYVGVDHPMADAKGYCYEHRLVMAAHLDRMLTSDEDVHHRNENPADNRIANLELMDHGGHSSHHRQANGYKVDLPRGEAHSSAKLSAEDVRFIRATCTGRRGEQKEMADRFGVSRAAVCAVVRGRSWRHLP